MVYLFIYFFFFKKKIFKMTEINDSNIYQKKWIKLSKDLEKKLKNINLIENNLLKEKKNIDLESGIEFISKNDVTIPKINEMNKNFEEKMKKIEDFINNPKTNSFNEWKLNYDEINKIIQEITPYVQFNN